MIKRAVKPFSRWTSLSFAIFHLLALVIAFFSNQILIVIMQDKRLVCQVIYLLNFIFIQNKLCKNNDIHLKNRYTVFYIELSENVHILFYLKIMLGVF
jgi:uncharacterized membrane protein